MKNTYPTYLKKTPDQLKAMWANALITFDTNVLLNIYRYSPSTRNEIFKLITSFKKRIFLTHQAGLEFHRNKYEVMLEQEKKHRDFLEKLKIIEDELASKHTPFIEAKLSKELDTVLEKVKNDINSSKLFYSNLFIDDEIYGEIDKLFSGTIDLSFTEQELENIYKEGEKRFQNKIPPGYEDNTKEGEKKYGDLILWKQIIRKAKKEKKSVIFITDEQKKDWWWKLKDGKIIGPRQELLEEIFKESQSDFHIYNTESFLTFGNGFLNQQSNKKAIDEVKEVQEKTNSFSNNLKFSSFSLNDVLKHSENLSTIKKQLQLENELLTELLTKREQLSAIGDLDEAQKKEYSRLNDFILFSKMQIKKLESQYASTNENVDNDFKKWESFKIR